MVGNFSFSMQQHPFKSEPLSPELIVKALDLVFEDALNGNDNFLVLQNDSNYHFIQTVFQDGMWRIEYSKAEGVIYRKYESDYKTVYAVFQAFYQGDGPDLTGYRPIKISELYSFSDDALT